MSAFLLSDISPLGDRNLAACVIILLLELSLNGAKASKGADIENHLELGKEFLARGQLADALTHYHAAVEGDPNNYLTLFKRGTVYLALGKTRFAIQDLQKALELKPDFTPARLQRGTAYMKSGEYLQATEDLANVLQIEPYNEDANELYSRIGPASEQWALVVDLMSRGDYRSSITLLTQLLEISPLSTTFRQTRADAYIAQNDYLAAISDLRSVNKLTQDSTGGYFRLAQLLYRIGHATSSLKEIRECLKLDPEHKDCFPFYKKLRKVEKSLSNAEAAKEEKRYADCISSAESVLNQEKEENMIMFEAKRLLCGCLSQNEEYTKAITSCNQALEIMKEAQILCDRADAYIGVEMYDDAIRDFQAALELDENLQRAKEGVDKAKRLQKQSERRDYYKILGVKRNANKQEIIKAYRKAAQKWHPDNFRDEEKKVAEKKFIDIAAAKEVLTDPEKRKQFDNGEDPLDPESGQQGFRGGHSHFHHFHHDSPFQFKFHFN